MIKNTLKKIGRILLANLSFIIAFILILFIFTVEFPYIIESPGSIINLDDESCREIVNHASIETIGYYGDIILQDNLREFCVNKYLNYVFEFYGNNDKDKSKHLRRKIINCLFIIYIYLLFI